MSDHSSNTVTFVDYGLSGSLDRVTLNLGPVARVVGEEIEGVDGSTSYRGTVEYALARGRVTLDENGSLDLVEVGLGKTFNVGGGKNLSGSLSVFGGVYFDPGEGIGIAATARI
jgi:hypothetical protein